MYHAAVAAGDAIIVVCGGFRAPRDSSSCEPTRGSSSLLIEHTFYGPPRLDNLVGNQQNECSALRNKLANMYPF